MGRAGMGPLPIGIVHMVAGSPSGRSYDMRLGGGAAAAIAAAPPPAAAMLCGTSLPCDEEPPPCAGCGAHEVHL